MNRSKQKGMNNLLLLFILVMVGFLLMCFFKLGPAYLDNRYIVSALRSLGESRAEELATMPKTEIRSELSKFYMLNNIRGDSANSIEIERLKDKTLVKVIYEVRVPMFGNLDAVMRFENVLDSSKPKECCTVSEAK